MPVLKKEETGTAEKSNGEYPVVSVIIPVYNSEKYTEKCICSLLGQTYRNLELLIIDDGSTDQSGAILDRLAGEDTRIRLIHQKNAGVAAARNRGIDLATGTYLTFVDGDDYVAPDYIQCLVDCARKNEAELVICGLQFVKEDGTCLKKVVPGTYRRFEQEEWTFRISAVCSHLYKKTLWDRWQIRFLSGERGEDMPISLFFSAICDKIVTLPEAGYFYVRMSHQQCTVLPVCRIICHRIVRWSRQCIVCRKSVCKTARNITSCSFCVSLPPVIFSLGEGLRRNGCMNCAIILPASYEIIFRHIIKIH